MAMHSNPLVSLIPGFGGVPVSDEYRKAANIFNAQATVVLELVCGEVLIGTLPKPVDDFIEALNGYFVTLNSGSEHQIAYMRQKVCFLAGKNGYDSFWNLFHALDRYAELALEVHKASKS